MLCLLCQQDYHCDFSLPHFLARQPDRADLLCPDCLAAFSLLTGPVCAGCGRSFAKGPFCADCCYWQRKGAPNLQHRALYHYNEQMKVYMAAYKFQGDYRLALVFRKELTAFVRRLKRHYQANLVLPIPVSPTRYQQRGFHQVAGLLAPGLRQQGLVVAQEPLQPQSALTRAARLASAQPFAIAENWQPHLKGQRILLVDDVYTTGRTLQHAAACVLAAGAQAVFSCSLAR